MLHRGKGAIFSSPEEFRCGVYVISFESERKAGSFIQRFAPCPIWPLIGPTRMENEVFVIAVEPTAQRHGRFEDDGNTLVEHPEFLGARSVRFRRDDGLLRLFPNHILETGATESVPCGSDCAGCSLLGRPCRGCPAAYGYPDPPDGSAGPR